MHIWKMSTVSIICKTKKYTVPTIIGKIETPHTQIHVRSLSLYTWKGVVLKLKQYWLLCILLEIFLLIICTLFTIYLSILLCSLHCKILKNICIFKDGESKMNYLFQLWNSYDAVSDCSLTPTQQCFSYIMARIS
jgi:hypothetical protein